MVLRNLVSVVTIALVDGASAQEGEVTADSLNVTQVGSVVLARERVVSDLYVAGSHAYVGSIGGILYIVDISQPSNMRKVAEVAAGGSALDVKVDGDMAVVGVRSESGGGVVVIDVSDLRCRRFWPGYPSRVECTTSFSTKSGPTWLMQMRRA